MVKVASLAVDVLERTKSRLMALLNQGIAMKTQEYGTEHFKAALEMNPATTPPKCIARLMNTCLERSKSSREISPWKSH